MKNAALILAFLVVLVGPGLLRPKQPGGGAEQTLIVITPHNESIRYEFGQAFAKSYLARTGQRVHVDFRTPGGTSEIGRYLDGAYVAGFENYWRNTLNRPWNGEVAKNFMNAKAKPDDPARAAFLASNVSSKIDVFFGGGAFDFIAAGGKGQLVDSGYITAHPELFGEGSGQIPQKLSGEVFYDKDGLWLGAVVSAYGIISNTDVLARLGISQAPSRWSDLADPRYFGQIALANPLQSSSINKAFEMLIQQQIAEGGGDPVSGWLRGLRLLQRIGANARYYTDSSTKPSLDVSTGDAAAGMTIDFYGRFQAESVSHRGGRYLQYANCTGGTSVSVDPIAILRGAPHPALAKEFVAFVLSPEGQKLWNWKVGTPGGPEHYALRRLPIRPALYAPELRAHRSDPEVLPYEMAKQFTYHDTWTASLFNPQRFIVRAMCIDSHDELRAAWKALIDHQFPPAAVAEFERLDAVDYAAAGGRIKSLLSSGNRIAEVQLSKELADGFRAQYQRAAELAKAGR